MIELTTEKKAEAWDQLCMLEGYPPHDNWSNICYGDGIFANSIKREFEVDTIEELADAIGLSEAAARHAERKKKVDKELSNPHAAKTFPLALLPEGDG